MSSSSWKDKGNLNGHFKVKEVNLTDLLCQSVWLWHYRKRWHDGDSKERSSQGFDERKDGMDGQSPENVLSSEIILILWWWIQIIIHLSKPIKHTTQRGKHINYRFYLIIIMWQYWPFSCNKCAMLMQDVNNREIGWWRILKEYRGTLFFPLNFSINLKQIKNTPLIKKNDAHSFFSLWNVYILHPDNLI